jgi:hypothetical protein
MGIDCARSVSREYPFGVWGEGVLIQASMVPIQALEVARSGPRGAYLSSRRGLFNPPEDTHSGSRGAFSGLRVLI